MLCWRPPGLALLLLLAGADPRAALAASLSPAEVQVLGKTLAFVQPLPSGATTIAVVYARGDAASLTDAGQIAAAIGDGVRVGNVVLNPQVVDLAALATIDAAVIVTCCGRKRRCRDADHRARCTRLSALPPIWQQCRREPAS